MRRARVAAALLALTMADARAEETLRKGWTPPTGAADEANVARGETLWGKCRACHTYEAGARHSVGPNLHGVFGRKAGTAPGFRRYSDALRNAEVVWTAETMDAYLKATLDYIPGSKMYAGLAIARDRLDLIAWLGVVTNAAPQSARNEESEGREGE